MESSRQAYWSGLPLPSPGDLPDPGIEPGSPALQATAGNEGDLDLIPGSGSSPGERKGLPTPVFWPGEFHGLYSPWDHKESDVTERL